MLDTAEQVLVALKEAREAQNEANDAIDKATDDISDAEGDLTQVDLNKFSSFLFIYVYILF